MGRAKLAKLMEKSCRTELRKVKMTIMTQIRRMRTRSIIRKKPLKPRKMHGRMVVLM